MGAVTEQCNTAVFYDRGKTCISTVTDCSSVDAQLEINKARIHGPLPEYVPPQMIAVLSAVFLCQLWQYASVANEAL